MTRENKDYDHITCQDAVNANYLATAQLDRPVQIHLPTTFVNENSARVMVESTLESYSKHTNGKRVPCLEFLRAPSTHTFLPCRIQQQPPSPITSHPGASYLLPNDSIAHVHVEMSSICKATWVRFAVFGGVPSCLQPSISKFAYSIIDMRKHIKNLNLTPQKFS